jgi:8-amino-7-oxononanoate synthase
VKHSIYFSQVNINQQVKLNNIINYFKAKKSTYLKHKIIGEGPIFAIILGENGQAKTLSQLLKNKEIDARPILSPTVPKGTERIRICLHAFNTPKEIDLLFETFNEFNE